MRVYITDVGKIGKIYLYYPNSKNECTAGFLNFFKEMPFEEITPEERAMYKNKAFYKTDEKTFKYWRNLFLELQEVFDFFDKQEKLHMLKLLGKPIFTNNKKPVKCAENRRIRRQYNEGR